MAAENKESKFVVIISTIFGVTVFGLIVYYFFKPVSASAANGGLTAQQLATIKQLQASAASGSSTSTSAIATLANSVLNSLFKGGGSASTANITQAQQQELDSYYQANYGMSYNDVVGQIDHYQQLQNKGELDANGNYITQSVTSNDLGSVYNTNQTVGGINGLFSGGSAIQSNASANSGSAFAGNNNYSPNADGTYTNMTNGSIYDSSGNLIG